MWLVNFRATDKVPVAATHMVPSHLDRELLGVEGSYLSLGFLDASRMLPFSLPLLLCLKSERLAFSYLPCYRSCTSFLSVFVFLTWNFF